MGPNAQYQTSAKLLSLVFVSVISLGFSKESSKVTFWNKTRVFRKVDKLTVLVLFSINIKSSRSMLSSSLLLGQLFMCSLAE